MAELLWGIDLGGTKIEGVIVEASAPSVPLARIRISTDQSRGYQHIIDQVRALVTDLERALGKKPTRIGFGTPGALNRPTGVMKNCNTSCLNGKPLAEDLQRALGLPVVVANDANCFALAESKFGAAQNASVVFGVILGTGIGGAVVIDGCAREGLQSIAGEWGHNVIDPHGALCYCGKRGCIEATISGPALEKFYGEQSGSKKSLAAIAHDEPLGDAAARATLERLTRYFGEAIAVVINILDPDVIVLGGGVSNLDCLYTEGRERAARHVFNPRLDTPIVRNQLGDSAGVFGAALLTKDK